MSKESTVVAPYYVFKKAHHDEDREFMRRTPTSPGRLYDVPRLPEERGPLSRCRAKSRPSQQESSLKLRRPLLFSLKKTVEESGVRSTDQEIFCYRRRNDLRRLLSPYWFDVNVGEDVIDVNEGK